MANGDARGRASLRLLEPPRAADTQRTDHPIFHINERMRRLPPDPVTGSTYSFTRLNLDFPEAHTYLYRVPRKHLKLRFPLAIASHPCLEHRRSGFVRGPRAPLES